MNSSTPLSPPSTSAATPALKSIGASTTAASSSAPYVPCSITAKQWDTVAVWSWDVQTKVCAICKGNLADQCISCQAQGSWEPATSAAKSARSTPHAGATPGAGSVATTFTANATHGASAVGASVLSSSPPFPSSRAGATTTTTAAMKYSTSATLADLNEKCCVAWGTCGHVFHYHCVSRWLQMRSMCPVCGRQWQLHKITSNE